MLAFILYRAHEVQQSHSLLVDFSSSVATSSGRYTAAAVRWSISSNSFSQVCVLRWEYFVEIHLYKLNVRQVIHYFRSRVSRGV